MDNTLTESPSSPIGAAEEKEPADGRFTQLLTNPLCQAWSDLRATRWRKFGLWVFYVA